MPNKREEDYQREDGRREKTSGDNVGGRGPSGWVEEAAGRRARQPGAGCGGRRRGMQDVAAGRRGITGVGVEEEAAGRGRGRRRGIK